MHPLSPLGDNNASVRTLHLRPTLLPAWVLHDCVSMRCGDAVCARMVDGQEVAETEEGGPGRKTRTPRARLAAEATISVSRLHYLLSRQRPRDASSLDCAPPKLSPLPFFAHAHCRHVRRASRTSPAPFPSSSASHSRVPPPAWMRLPRWPSTPFPTPWVMAFTRAPRSASCVCAGSGGRHVGTNRVHVGRAPCNRTRRPGVGMIVHPRQFWRILSYYRH
jgi:hypothetical protein